MSLPIRHVNPPDNFVYVVKIDTTDPLLHSIYLFYNPTQICIKNGETYASPLTGLYFWDEIKCWVYNQQKQGYFVLYFESKECFETLLKNINNLKVKKLNAIMHKLYRYDHRGWTCSETYNSFDDTYLIGYNDYLKIIESEIISHRRNQALLTSIGEFKSLNYLLYGVPGTGKTTMLKSLSSKYNMDVYIVNCMYATAGNINNLLNPRKSSNENIILVFEDFDRFIAKAENKDLMGIILNAMDGFDDSANTIRFFTGNDCSVIFNEPALINRISCKFKFDYPTFDMFKNKFLKLTSISSIIVDENKLNTFIELIVNAKYITLRPFTSYCIRYLFKPNGLDEMICNINDLITQ